MRPVLSPAERADLPELLPLWVFADDARSISREFQFADFAQAFAFMAAVAGEAERLDHHPEWSNVYNRVSIRLTTHDSGGVTRSDIQLAEFIDRCALSYHI